MKKTVFIFSALIVALLVLFQLSKYTYASDPTSIEIIIAMVAVIFLTLGIYINKKILNKSIASSHQKINTDKIKELGISNREYEVLIEISKGFSNKDIAEKLCITESTIKTHVSSLFIKLDSKRRTQALQKANELQIINT